MLHTRRFLSYHGERFIDRSFLVFDNDKLVGVFPAAEHSNLKECVVSHPGATYGGVVHSGDLRGEKMITAFQLIMRELAQLNYNKLIYKAVPHFYQVVPAQDDLYALFRLGAKSTRVDLSCTIDLFKRARLSERRRRGIKKASKSGITLSSSLDHLPEFWSVLRDNLERKHSAKPVHSLSELELLTQRFPHNVSCMVAVMQKTVVAGVLFFVTDSTCHAQYIASSEEGYQYSALDLLFEKAIESATVSGKRWFDFGICTELNGSILNEGLFQFKSEFGAGSTTHEFYELDVRSKS